MVPETVAPETATPETPPELTPKPSPVEGTQILSARLPVSGMPVVEAMIQLHYRMQHIPEPTVSKYIQYLLTQDAERMREEIKQRRAKVTGS